MELSYIGFNVFLDTLLIISEMIFQVNLLTGTKHKKINITTEREDEDGEKLLAVT